MSVMFSQSGVLSPSTGLSRQVGRDYRKNRDNRQSQPVLPLWPDERWACKPEVKIFGWQAGASNQTPASRERFRWCSRIRGSTAIGVPVTRAAASKGNAWINTERTHYPNSIASWHVSQIEIN
jgi:hypothetical protein